MKQSGGTRVSSRRSLARSMRKSFISYKAPITVQGAPSLFLMALGNSPCTERSFVASMNPIVPPQQKMRKALRVIPATGASFPLSRGRFVGGVGHEGYRSDLRSSVAASRSHKTFDSPQTRILCVERTALLAQVPHSALPHTCS